MRRMAPVPREELFSEYFGPCYSTSQEATVGMQDLGLIYAVFSNGMALPLRFVLFSHLILTSPYSCP